MSQSILNSPEAIQLFDQLMHILQYKPIGMDEQGYLWHPADAAPILALLERQCVIAIGVLEAKARGLQFAAGSDEPQ